MEKGNEREEFSHLRTKTIIEQIYHGKYEIWVIVMFDSRASANAFLPDEPILLLMECDMLMNNHSLKS